MYDSMRTSKIKNQVIDYLPMLSPRQQTLVLEMIKSFLNVESESKNLRISVEEYNKEIDEAIERLEQGSSISHEEVTKELSRW
jgi:hypothetical protein